MSAVRIGSMAGTFSWLEGNYWQSGARLVLCARFIVTEAKPASAFNRHCPARWDSSLGPPDCRPPLTWFFAVQGPFPHRSSKSVVFLNKGTGLN